MNLPVIDFSGVPLTECAETPKPSKKLIDYAKLYRLLDSVDVTGGIFLPGDELTKLGFPRDQVLLIEDLWSVDPAGAETLLRLFASLPKSAGAVLRIYSEDPQTAQVLLTLFKENRAEAKKMLRALILSRKVVMLATRMFPTEMELIKAGFPQQLVDLLNDDIHRNNFAVFRSAVFSYLKNRSRLEDKNSVENIVDSLEQSLKGQIGRVLETPLANEPSVLKEEEEEEEVGVGELVEEEVGVGELVEEKLLLQPHPPERIERNDDYSVLLKARIKRFFDRIIAIVSLQTHPPEKIGRTDYDARLQARINSLFGSITATQLHEFRADFLEDLIVDEKLSIKSIHELPLSMLGPQFGYFNQIASFPKPTLGHFLTYLRGRYDTIKYIPIDAVETKPQRGRQEVLIHLSAELEKLKNSLNSGRGAPLILSDLATSPNGFDGDRADS